MVRPSSWVHGLAVDGTRIVFSSYDVLHYVDTESGRHEEHRLPTLEINSVAIDGQRLIAATSGEGLGIYVADDPAGPFRPSNDGLPPSLNCHDLARVETELYVTCASALFRSSDGGSSWAAVVRPVGDVNIPSIYSLRAVGSVLYAGVLTEVTAASQSFMFRAALRSDGTVWGWGENWWGQLGNNATGCSATPVQRLVSNPGWLRAPDGLTAIASPTSLAISLAWGASTGATSYNLYWSLSPNVSPLNGTRISGITGASYQHANLVGGTRYYYVVTSVGGGTESVGSAVATGASVSPPTVGALLGTFPVGPSPMAVAVDGQGNAWVAMDGAEGVVKKLASDGTVLGSFTAGPWLVGIAIDSSGNAWVHSSGQGAVIKLGPDGSSLGTYPVGSNWGTGIAIDPQDNVWVVTSYGVKKLAPNGSWQTCPYWSGPSSIAIDRDGSVWVAGNDAYGTVTKFAPDCSTLGVFTTGRNSPRGLAANIDGTVWVLGSADSNGESLVTRLASSGTIAGSYPTGFGPYGVVADRQGNVWVSNRWDDNVTKFGAGGDILGTFPVGRGPWAIATDGHDDIWVANYGGTEVMKLGH